MLCYCYLYALLQPLMRCVIVICAAAVSSTYVVFLLYALLQPPMRCVIVIGRAAESESESESEQGPRIVWKLGWGVENSALKCAV